MTVSVPCPGEQRAFGCCAGCPGTKAERSHPGQLGFVSGLLLTSQRGFAPAGEPSTHIRLHLAA